MFCGAQPTRRGGGDIIKGEGEGMSGEAG